MPVIQGSGDLSRNRVHHYCFQGISCICGFLDGGIRARHDKQARHAPFHLSPFSLSLLFAEDTLPLRISQFVLLLLFFGLFRAQHVESLHIGSRREDALTAILSGPESAAAGTKRRRGWRRFGAGSFLHLCLRLHPHPHLYIRLPSLLRRLYLRQAAPSPGPDDLACLACPVDRRRAGAGALWVGRGAGGLGSAAVAAAARSSG